MDVHLRYTSSYPKGDIWIDIGWVDGLYTLGRLQVPIRMAPPNPGRDAAYHQFYSTAIARARAACYIPGLYVWC
jgi:hypothetical protein